MIIKNRRKMHKEKIFKYKTGTEYGSECKMQNKDMLPWD